MPAPGIADRRLATQECFVICPLGDVGSPVRSRADSLRDRLLIPVLEPRGYRVNRSDSLRESGMITDQIIQRLRGAELVVADLSGLNPNVYYELAVRHVFRLPTVHLCDRGDRLPFDVRGLRVMEVDRASWDGLDEARREFGDFVTAAERVGHLENPIAGALRRWDDMHPFRLGQLLAEMTGFRALARNLGRGFVEELKDLADEAAQSPEVTSRELQRRLRFLAELARSIYDITTEGSAPP